jgi:nitrogen regulatory protein P-II 2
MQLYPLKLVTVVGETVITKAIIAEGLRLGASGFTLTDVDGRGSRDARTGIMIGSAKTRKIEFVVSEAVAVAILEHISHTYFEHYACIAWLSDVSVVRGEHYVARER